MSDAIEAQRSHFLSDGRLLEGDESLARVGAAPAAGDQSEASAGARNLA